ncbi:hypothetical protein BK026_18670 [Alteromonas sp. V450]|uniref:hypothetical protein n=1 Tax=Alteromonas sp. V450 TaxID=1912139 RepID=UPI0008FF5105|nr:hypothetical protein [Alteromonas sp. V450]OJF70630.1 hypothetical protein BK026_18670 [Alteromonas sp. V450]
MNQGKGWVLIEAFFNTGENRFLSILSSRRSPDYVKQYMEQKYIDSYASIEEKFLYKKQPRRWPYPSAPYDKKYPYVLRCGHEPLFIAMYCHKLELKGGNQLYYSYKYFKGERHGHATFKEMVECVDVN